MAYDDENNIELEEENEEEEEQEESGEQVELDDKDAKIKELEEELAKEREKEKNFKNLKENEKGKRLKIGERVEAVEKLLEQERANRQALQDSILKDAKQSALDQLAGDDKEMRQKLEERVKDSETYLGAPQDSKELIERYEKAYSYLEGSQRKVNPLHAYSPVTGMQQDQPRSKRFTDTPEGKQLLESKFGKVIDEVKAKNPKFKI